MIEIGVRKNIWLALLLLWALLIFILSSQSGLASRGNPPLWFYVERKGAHVFEYFVLTLLAFRHFGAYYRGKERNIALLFAVAVALIYGMTDEIHQTFVPGREGKISDVGIDCIGIALFVCGYLVWRQYRKKISNT